MSKQPFWQKVFNNWALALCLSLLILSLFTLALTLVVYGFLLDFFPNPAQGVIWLQTFSGNWSPPNWPIHPHDQLKFCLFAAIAILLNNSTAIVICAALWRAFISWGKKMRLSQAVAILNQTNTQALLSAFGDDTETIEKVRNAFKIGHQEWFDEIQHLFGPGEATRLRDMLQRDI